MSGPTIHIYIVAQTRNTVHFDSLCIKISSSLSANWSVIANEVHSTKSYVVPGFPLAIAAILSHVDIG